MYSRGRYLQSGFPTQINKNIAGELRNHVMYGSHFSLFAIRLTRAVAGLAIRLTRVAAGLAIRLTRVAAGGV